VAAIGTLPLPVMHKDIFSRARLYAFVFKDLTEYIE
jgi:hypothetical protein